MNPVAAYRRWRLRRAATLLARHGYEAARPSRLDGWNPADQMVNHLIASASPRLRARVRDMVRNFPLFSRGLNGYTAFVVGRGARFQSLATLPDGSPALAVRRTIEERFRAWMAEEADISSHMHLYQMQQLACRQIMESGEALTQMVMRKNWRINPLALMPLEVDRLTDLGARGDHEAKIHMGVEYLPATGEALAYHIANDGYSCRVSRVEAQDMLHVFQVLRPGQLRGVTPFAPAIIFARAMADYTQSELDAAKMSSKYMAFVSSDDIEAFQGARGLRKPGGGAVIGSEDTGAPIETLENGIIEYLRPQEKISFADLPTRPGDAFANFCTFVARMVSITIDVPYEILTGDYTGINYSTSKAIRGDTQMLLAPHKFLHEHQFAARIFRRWLDLEALTQNYLPGYWQNPERYRKALWIPAGQPSVDPLRDGKADIDAVTAMHKAPQECILARGGDPEEVLGMAAAWRDMLRQHGLDAAPVASISTTTANNPAKLGAPEMGAALDNDAPESAPTAQEENPHAE